MTVPAAVAAAAFKKWAEPPKSTPSPPPPPGLLSTVPALWKDGRTRISTVDKALVKTPIIMELAHLTKTSHLLVLLYLVGALVYAILVIANVYAGFLTSLFAAVWPVMFSLRAAESMKKEDVQLWSAAMIFTAWLIFPWFNGSLLIYHSILKNLVPKPPPQPPKPDPRLSKWAYVK
ncbi:hypothetical protein HDU83_001391 [Entophlyctis luteolus]|nr:hypothetical protein HDU83_001391 [Entophlyctis luteolus]